MPDPNAQFPPDMVPAPFYSWLQDMGAKMDAISVDPETLRKNEEELERQYEEKRQSIIAAYQELGEKV